MKCQEVYRDTIYQMIFETGQDKRISLILTVCWKELIKKLNNIFRPSGQNRPVRSLLVETEFDCIGIALLKLLKLQVSSKKNPIVNRQ